MKDYSIGRVCLASDSRISFSLEWDSAEFGYGLLSFVQRARVLCDSEYTDREFVMAVLNKYCVNSEFSQQGWPYLLKKYGSPGEFSKHVILIS